MMFWILWLAPLAVIACVCIAIKHTQIKRYEATPTWLKTSTMNMNGPDRRWGLK